jgi:hypothetical protein
MILNLSVSVAHLCDCSYRQDPSTLVEDVNFTGGPWFQPYQIMALAQRSFIAKLLQKSTICSSTKVKAILKGH